MTLTATALPSLFQPADLATYLASSWTPEQMDVFLKSLRKLRNERPKAEKRSYIMHGHSKTRLYRLWSSMKSRHAYFSAQGIEIKDEWSKEFPSFYAWANESGYTEETFLFRKDNSLGFTPENCYFRTKSNTTQLSTQRQPRNQTFRIGEDEKTLRGWSETSGIAYATLHSRVKRGCTGYNLIAKVHTARLFA